MLSWSFSGPDDGPAVQGLHLVLRFGADGDATARGTVHVRDGTSNTVLIAGAAQAACADTDGDGVAGITALELFGRHPLGGEELLVFFLGGHELDARGEYPVGVRVGDVASQITLTFLPLPAGPPAGSNR